MQLPFMKLRYFTCLVMKLMVESFISLNGHSNSR
ncbi:hypothetical protein [Sulfolobus tengchongensis spindle-shaped virus 3]|nr:hypothetical protein [Sulfolobus tengchongensis spindle-shaped virus 3]